MSRISRSSEDETEILSTTDDADDLDDADLESSRSSQWATLHEIHQFVTHRKDLFCVAVDVRAELCQSQPCPAFLNRDSSNRWLSPLAVEGARPSTSHAVVMLSSQATVQK